MRLFGCLKNLLEQCPQLLSAWIIIETQYILNKQILVNSKKKKFPNVTSNKKCKLKFDTIKKKIPNNNIYFKFKFKKYLNNNIYFKFIIFSVGEVWTIRSGTSSGRNVKSLK